MSIEVFRKDSHFVRVGEIQDSGTVINNSGAICGRIRHDGLLVGQDGNFLGRIHRNGAITTSISELSIVTIDPSGNIYSGYKIIGRLKIDWSSPIPRERAVYAAWTLLNSLN